MALRNIVKKEDEEPRLRKHSREVTAFDDRLHILLDDMAETLMESNGVGLAAPQVGVLRRAVLVLETNVDEENGEEPYIIELINPEIVFAEGEQYGAEGCLSVPGIYGDVSRPEKVRVHANDREGNVFEVEGEGLTARAMCHEIDHLEGKLFLDLADRVYTAEELEEMEQEED